MIKTMVDNDSDDKRLDTNENKERKETKAMERRQQMRLQYELYQLHTLDNPTILEEERIENVCMGLMDFVFSIVLENEGEKTPSTFQEVWWHPSFPKHKMWQKIIQFRMILGLGVWQQKKKNMILEN